MWGEAHILAHKAGYVWCVCVMYDAHILARIHLVMMHYVMHLVDVYDVCVDLVDDI